ncbi:MAG: type II secretion system F family protein [Planctomycetes bacterium]|nr:type II secretion system F family protein [Planctomycetota bacterium]
MTLVISLFVGASIAALVGSILFAFRVEPSTAVEARLSTLTLATKASIKAVASDSLLRNNQQSQSEFEKLISSKFNVTTLLELADAKITVEKFALLCIGLGVASTILCLLAPISPLFAPLAGSVMFYAPIFLMKWRGKRRIAKFNTQLPDALDMLSRSLKAGHSLGSGFGLISQEVAAPLGREFGRCFEEQNLGVSLEQSLESMATRIPNLDLRFFATAVILQRQTGGDLAEILEKISQLIRARFRLAGQIQALTGEGRLSGIVLLALPPGLFLMMFCTNREYVMKLFTDPMGKWMLGGTIILQLIGAWTIKKIIDIKV